MEDKVTKKRLDNNEVARKASSNFGIRNDLCGNFFEHFKALAYK